MPSTYEYEDDGDESSDRAGAETRQGIRVCVEIDPPKGLNPTKALDGARLLKEAGVDAINVADSPMARVRMSALTMSLPDPGRRSGSRRSSISRPATAR